ncbi:B-cell lymphoma 3 protein isoform X2 [Sceloporus undulatus]|uniref:B-cell lymphoma 3 protein isoform X2 n=1 Tax=Sceloporus undulatus TaxID=8520 RepID=UPI001C4B87AD|nr:B-cell lymphoma 3 protein isoform X2 [Sceloporus undulatus]
MAGESPVDLRRGRPRWEAKEPGPERPPLPLRKRRRCYASEEDQGPKAAPAPQPGGLRQQRGPGLGAASGGWELLLRAKAPSPPPGPPGFTGSFLNPELAPILHPVTPSHPLLGVPVPYSLLCSIEAQLALDIATATKQDEDGDTPLHIAVVQGNLMAVQRLVALFHQGHRDVDTFNNLRQTPLHLAVITAQPALVKLLLVHGASPMVLDRHGQTALHLACEHGNLRCLQELLDGSPVPLDLEARNFEGLTPLHVAVGTSNHNVVLTLLEHGADVDAVDIKSGRSPLLHAVENNNMEMVELLLKHGASVNAQSYGGNTALHAASGRGFLDMLRLLVRNGADGSLKNYHNDTPLMVAKNKRVIDILRGKASHSGLAPDNVHDRPSPANSMASSPGLQPAHSGLPRSSPDTCPAAPSPSRTPKPQRAGQSFSSANQKLESIISTNETPAPGPLHGVKLERSPTPPTPEQPMGFLGMHKYFLPITEGMVDPAFHAPLYSFLTSSHNLSPHPLHLLPISLNPSVITLPPASLAGHLHPRGMGTEQSQTLLDSENLPTSSYDRQWLPHRDSGPGTS